MCTRMTVGSPVKHLLCPLRTDYISKECMIGEQKSYDKMLKGERV